MARDRADNALHRVISKHDTPCGRCGFNLRGVDLGRGGVCPECGLEVSLRTLLGGEARESAKLRVNSRVKRARGISRVMLLLLLTLLGFLIVLRLTMG